MAEPALQLSPAEEEAAEQAAGRTLRLIQGGRGAAGATEAAVEAEEGLGVIEALGVGGASVLAFLAVLFWPSSVARDEDYLPKRANSAVPVKPDLVQQCPLQASSKDKKPVMDPNLSPAEQALWKKCTQLHDTYKDTQRAVADNASKIKELADRLSNNKGSAQDKLDLCLLLDRQIDEAQQLHQQRTTYVENGCDKFDYYNEGTTEQERRTAHEGEMANVDRQIKNLFELKRRFCP
jgi:hypothetical protein